MTFLDRTFCASLGCKNDCGRKMSQEQRTYLDRLIDADGGECHLVSQAYFCGAPAMNDFTKEEFKEIE